MSGERSTRHSAVEAPALPSGAAIRPFVGRTRELQLLRDALEEAASGRSGLLLVTGEPGIGKTRLMQELARGASERRWRVLVGRCWEEGGAPAYWPWIQVVRQAGGEFERLSRPVTMESEPVAVDPESLRFALFDSATRFLVDAARRDDEVVRGRDAEPAELDRDGCREVAGGLQRRDRLEGVRAVAVVLGRPRGQLHRELLGARDQARAGFRAGGQLDHATATSTATETPLVTMS